MAGRWKGKLDCPDVDMHYVSGITTQTDRQTDRQLEPKNRMPLETISGSETRGHCGAAASSVTERAMASSYIRGKKMLSHLTTSSHVVHNSCTYLTPVSRV
jgi:hypothetical protein